MKRQQPKWWRAGMALLLPLAFIAAACGDDDDDAASDGTAADDEGLPPLGREEPVCDAAAPDVAEDTGTVNVLNAMEPAEAEAVQTAVDGELDADYTAEIEANSEFEEQLQIRAEGETLDVALVPQPGGALDLAESGQIVALEDLGFDIAELEEIYGEYYMSLTECDGKHWGLPTNINLKSMIWYPVDDFDEAGYEVPETWDDLVTLSDQIIEDGGTPWCAGFESGGASGWPATDWMEDIMLRTAGTDAYDDWVNHELRFTDEAVVEAAEHFGEIMFTEDYLLGGASNSTSVAFGDAPGPMFEDPPNCWLHRQASFINAFFPEDAVAGEDYDWFPFPSIDEDNTLFGGEFAVIGTAGNREEVRDFLSQFIGEDIQCAMGGEAASSRVSPNLNVGSDCYANEILADASDILHTAQEDGTGRFDASDMLPSDVNETYWTEMLGYLQDGPDSAEDHLRAIEESWS